jgi:DNA (cytosine-5)-methyltransferase 1
MRYLSVCSGIEAATSAWHHMGWEPVAFSEIEPFPSAVLQHHYPNVPNWGDMTKYQTWPDATIDLLVGGTPCQSFSVAGLRQGLKDPRGNLMLTFLGIADRYRPKYIVWENVPGVLSSNGGRDFGSFLGALGELGYGWAYRVLDAQWFGVAQRRRRVFVVGCLGDQRRAAEVLFESESVRRDTPPSREKGQGAAADVAGSLGSRGNKSHTELDGHGAYVPRATWWDGGQISQTLDAVLQKGQMMPEKNRFPAVLQPHAFKVRGGCEGGGKGYLGSDDTAFTVATHQDQHIAQPIAFAKTHKPMSSTDPEGWSPAEVSPTITHWPRDRSDDGTDVAVAAHQDQHIATYPINGMCINKELRDKQMTGIGEDKDSMFTLRSDGTQHAVAQTMQVRRLTPVECERLQGFRDNHTNIPWRGKAEAPDGPRYKALGNSMAVPVMRWIGERINKP